MAITPNELCKMVADVLDKALEHVPDILSWDAQALAEDLQFYSTALEAVDPEDLLPHAQAWLLAKRRP